MISKLTIRKIDNGYVVKSEYPQEDFNNPDGEEFLQDKLDILKHVEHALGVERSENGEPKPF